MENEQEMFTSSGINTAEQDHNMQQTSTSHQTAAPSVNDEEEMAADNSQNDEEVQSSQCLLLMQQLGSAGLREEAEKLKMAFMESEESFGLENAQIQDLDVSSGINTVGLEYNMQQPSTSSQTLSPIVVEPDDNEAENVEDNRKDLSHQWQMLVEKRQEELAEAKLRVELAKLQVAMVDDEIKFKREAYKIKLNILKTELEFKKKQSLLKERFNKD